MGLKIQFSSNELIRIPEGEYSTTIIEITEVMIFKKRTFNFKFKITRGDHAGVIVNGWVNGNYEKFGSHTKFVEWYVCATGFQFEPSHTIDSDDFKNRELKVLVRDATSKKTGNKFSNVKKILGCVYEA